jgi:WD40 repeat protein
MFHFSILTLENISELIFASGSSDGQVILWLSKNLIRSIELRPFDELNANSLTSGLNLTSISCIRSYCERYLIIASGNCLSIYDNYNRDYSCKVQNAHNCKITDILILE